MGLGHFGGGLAVARWLACNGAEVTVTDLADANALAEPLAQLAAMPIARYTLGGHREADFRDIDLLVVNPAVRPGNPFVQIAMTAGVRIATEIELFLEQCPANVVGVTGSNGKSTTTAMIDSILRADSRISWLGGNLGGSLLDQLSAIQADDWVVLELSSFQLWRFSQAARAPRVAVVTSFAPNHLDWHVDHADYRSAKQKLLLGQGPDDFAVLNTLDAEVATWAPLARGKLIPLPLLEEIPLLRIPGRHNQINAACAATAGAAVGCSSDAIRKGLEQFTGLPERLELAANLDGIEVYNDSSSTTPESTVAAIEAISRPVWLMAGGHNKGLDYSDLTATIVKHCRGAAFFGDMRDALRNGTITREQRFVCTAARTLEEALAWCLQRAQFGEAIVFSPGCSSHDQFTNYRHRGDVFRAHVAFLAKRNNR